MTDAGIDVHLSARRARTQGLVGVGVLLAILVVGLLWAKWLPYAHRAHALSDSRAWSGSPIFSSAGEAGSAPTWHGTWSFWTAYFIAVWKAAVVALLVAATLESLVPRRWLLKAMARRGWMSQGLAAGALALPSMMCTCCTAPVAVGLRRRGAPLGATIAYWLANPLLNPAVILFLALTLPARYAVVRIVIGIAVVLGGAALGARLRPDDGRESEAAVALAGSAPDAGDGVSWARLPLRFVKALGRYLLILVPEYVVVVLLTGALSGWLSNFAGLDSAAAPISVLIVGIIGALLVIPTGGEIPVIAGLLAAGAGAGVTGVLLVTLPAISLPSLVMVARTLSWRPVAALSGLVMVGGLLASVLVAATS